MNAGDRGPYQPSCHMALQGFPMEAAVSPNPCHNGPHYGHANVPVSYRMPSMMQEASLECADNNRSSRFIPSILGNATHDQLVQSGNNDHLGLLNAYRRLVRQHEDLKDAYIAMAKTAQPFFSAVSNPLDVLRAQSSGSPAALQPPVALDVPPPLDPKDYPKVRFWTVKSWNAFLELSGTNVKFEKVSSSFIEDKDGVPLSKYRLVNLRAHARDIFDRLLAQGKVPNYWGEATVVQVSFYRQEMYERYPELRYCEGHWKVDKIAPDVYSRWQKGKTTTVGEDDAKVSTKRKQGKNTKPLPKKARLAPESPEASLLSSTPMMASSALDRPISPSNQPVTSSTDISAGSPNTPTTAIAAPYNFRSDEDSSTHPPSAAERQATSIAANHSTPAKFSSEENISPGTATAPATPPSESQPVNMSDSMSTPLRIKPENEQSDLASMSSPSNEQSASSDVAEIAELWKRALQEKDAL